MKLDSFTRSTLPDRIYAWHVSKAQDWRRPHLGASQIGKPCARAIWYSFRWALAPTFSGRMLRLFETGNLAEGRIFLELKNIEIKVYGEQKHVFISSHFSGSIDGIGEGFEESKVPHLLEVKTHNKKSWDLLNKDGVEASKPEHYCQMQTYMGGLKLSRAYYLAINKDTDEIYAERVRYDAGAFEAIKARAEDIIYSATPPQKIADSIARFECRFCDYKNLCHIKDKPQVNCRTCAHSTPERDGTWSCAREKIPISTDYQKEGCIDHLFIPDLLNMEVVSASPDSVEYENGWVNKNNSWEYKV